MNYQKIQVKQLSGAGGAEITGIDLASADDQTIAEIESALHEFLVVTLPDQPLDDAQLARFTSRLGAFGLEPPTSTVQRRRRALRSMESTT